MFYLIGLGLEIDSITLESKNIIEKCSKVYLETYTVDFHYSIDKLEQSIGKKIEKLNREKVESESFLRDAKKEDIALLVFGSPLDATTHISLILKCKKDKIRYRVIHNASVFDAITETGLQLYKFGKTTSMPKFQKNFEPSSFLEVVKDNQSIKAHSLILTDIGLDCKNALIQLEKAMNEKSIKIDKIILCSKAGTDESKIYYDTIKYLIKKEIKMPFCIIIPSELHFVELEALEQLKEK